MPYNKIKRSSPGSKEWHKVLIGPHFRQTLPKNATLQPKGPSKIKTSISADVSEMTHNYLSKQNVCTQKYHSINIGVWSPVVWLRWTPRSSICLQQQILIILRFAPCFIGNSSWRHIILNDGRRIRENHKQWKHPEYSRNGRPADTRNWRLYCSNRGYAIFSKEVSSLDDFPFGFVFFSRFALCSLSAKSKEQK